MGWAGLGPQHQQTQLLQTDGVFLAGEQGSDQSIKGTIYFWTDEGGRIRRGPWVPGQDAGARRLEKAMLLQKNPSLLFGR